MFGERWRCTGGQYLRKSSESTHFHLHQARGIDLQIWHSLLADEVNPSVPTYATVRRTQKQIEKQRKRTVPKFTSTHVHQHRKILLQAMNLQ